jgi:hypothetical protein
MVAKSIKKVAGMVMVSVMLVGQAGAVFATDGVNELAPYEAELETLNEELGTDYALQQCDGTSYEEMVDFFTSMSMDEFDAYIHDAYIAEKEFEEKEDSKLITVMDENANARSTLSTQKFYYDGSNYLYMKAYTTTVSKKTVYTGDVSSTGYSISSYPAYKSTSCTVSFSSDKKTATCKYKCTKYVSANVISTGTYTKTCTFSAGGGNIYPEV